MSVSKIKRILIVDDDRDQCETLAELIEGWGHGTEVAFDGLDARKILLTQKFDLILTDIRMPNMNGVDLIKFVNATSKPPPIIVLSGFNDHSEIELKDLKVKAFLKKPVSIDQLRYSIEAAFAQ